MCRYNEFSFWTNPKILIFGPNIAPQASKLRLGSKPILKRAKPQKGYNV